MRTTRFFDPHLITFPPPPFLHSFPPFFVSPCLEIHLYKKFKIYDNKRLLYCFNIFASLILQLMTWLHQNFIFLCSNLVYQIGQKIVHDLEKKSAQSDHFYRFYACFKLCPDVNLHNCSVWKIAVKPVKIVRLSWFFFQNYIKFLARSDGLG